MINGRAAMSWGANDGYINEIATGSPQLFEDIEVHLNLQRKQRVTTVFFNSLGVNSHSRHPEKAWQVIEYLMSPDVIVEFTKSIGSLPPRLSLVRSARLRHIPKAERFMQQLEYAHQVEAHPKYFELRSLAGAEFIKALRQEASPLAALAQAAARWRPILRTP